jgi:membrane protein YqaA with SNARE-associated domain
MRDFLVAIFGGLLSWWGLWLIGALDSTIFLFLPLGVDIAVVILAARTRELFWVYPIIAVAGSLCGAAITYYMGLRLGEAGLKHFVSEGRLNQFRRRVEEKGAVALAVLDLIPPPFPFTACVLAAGALKVDRSLFFVTLGITRLVRFGGEAVLAYFYGPHIIRWLTSDTVEYIGTALFAAAVIGTAITTIRLVLKTRMRRRGSNKRHAA